jgi:hypothetical protein
MLIPKKYFLNRTLLHLAVLLVFIFSTSDLYSQKYHYGVLFGGDIGSPITKDIPKGSSGKPLPGINMGAFGGVEFNENFRIEISLNYAHLSSQFNTVLDSMPYVDKIPHPIYEDIIFEVETFFNGTANGLFDNAYIQKQINQYFRLNKNLELIIGTYSSILLSANSYIDIEGTAGFDPTLIQDRIIFSDYTRKIDYGLSTGINYWFNNHINIKSKLMYGFNSIFTEELRELPYEVKNLFLQVNINYHFHQDIVK